MDLRILRGSVLVFAARVANPAATVLLGLLIARQGGVAVFGQYSFMVTYCFVMSMMFSLGIGTLIARDTAKAPQEVRGYFTHASVVGAAAGMAGLAIALLTAPFFRMSGESLTAFNIVSISIIPSILIVIWESLLITFEKQRAILAIQGAEGAIRLGLGWMLLSGGAGLVAIMTLFLVTRAASCAVYYLALRHYFHPLSHSISRPFLAHMLRATMPFAALYVFSVVLSKADTVMLAAMRDYQEVGIYSAAYKLMEIGFLFPTCVVSVLFPVLSRHAHESPDEFVHVSERAVLYSAVVFLPAVIACWLVSDIIIVKVYSAAFRDSIVPFRILIASLSFYLIDQIYAHSLVACNRQNQNLSALVGATVLNLCLNVILIPRYGATGAAVATLVSLVCLAVCHYCLVHTVLYRARAVSMLGWVVLAGLSYSLLAIPGVPRLILFVLASAAYALVLRCVWWRIGPMESAKVVVRASFLSVEPAKTGAPA
jgi:O-antigen/teichoic acid export membrane protein